MWGSQMWVCFRITGNLLRYPQMSETADPVRCLLFFFFFTYPSKTFIYLSLAALDLHCCARAFSSCGEQGLLSTFSVWASHCAGLLL